jgi:hypothetical protein
MEARVDWGSGDKWEEGNGERRLHLGRRWTMYQRGAAIRKLLDIYLRLVKLLTRTFGLSVLRRRSTAFGIFISTVFLFRAYTGSTLGRRIKVRMASIVMDNMGLHYHSGTVLVGGSKDQGRGS